MVPDNDSGNVHVLMHCSSNVVGGMDLTSGMTLSTSTILPHVVTLTAVIVSKRVLSVVQGMASTFTLR